MERSRKWWTEVKSSFGGSFFRCFCIHIVVVIFSRLYNEYLLFYIFVLVKLEIIAHI